MGMDHQYSGNCTRSTWRDYGLDVLEHFHELNISYGGIDSFERRQEFLAQFPNYASHTQPTTAIQIELWLHAMGYYSAEWIADYESEFPAEAAAAIAAMTPATIEGIAA